MNRPIEQLISHKFFLELHQTGRSFWHGTSLYDKESIEELSLA